VKQVFTSLLSLVLIAVVWFAEPVRGSRTAAIVLIAVVCVT
jgi:hypothetical protein